MFPWFFFSFLFHFIRTYIQKRYKHTQKVFTPSIHPQQLHIADFLCFLPHKHFMIIYERYWYGRHNLQSKESWFSKPNLCSGRCRCRRGRRIIQAEITRRKTGIKFNKKKKTFKKIIKNEKKVYSKVCKTLKDINRHYKIKAKLGELWSNEENIMAVELLLTSRFA